MRSRWVLGGILALAMMFVGAAAAQTLPQYGADRHVGVTSCAGSTCHGAAAPWRNSTVLQNEYITWEQKDRHARAYKTLLTERSQRIARNLGIGPAHEAKVCLDCHAHNPQAEKRGRVFQVSDGVGCEACHGGAERWLGVHVTGLGNHEDNIKAGLYPTEDPIARARLCMSCHFGDENKFVTHRIMGAGHPRMSFELDTFTAIQPAHYVVDDDYRKRKRVSNGVQTWAVGQAMAMTQVLEGLIDPKRNRDGIFPELVFFDCHACHHPMSNVRWEPRATVGLPPGVPRLNDSNLVMLRIIAQRVDRALADRMRQQALALHKASTQGNEATVVAARALRETTNGLAQRFAAHSFGREDMQALLAGVVSAGKQGEYIDYAGAEQATMAIGAIITAMKAAGVVDEASFKAMRNALDKLYEATAKDEEYKPRVYVAALQAFEQAIPKF